MEKIEEYFEKFQIFFQENPRYVWLLVAAIFVPLGIGSILGKNWAIDPANSRQRVWYSILGHKAFGIIMGIGFTVVGVASLGMFFMTA